MYSLNKSVVVLETSVTSLCIQSDCFLHTLHLPSIDAPTRGYHLDDGDLQFNSAKIT